MKLQRPLEPQLAPSTVAFLKNDAAEPLQTQVATLVQLILRDAVAARTSDIHLDAQESSYRIRFRVDGALHDVTTLDHELGKRVLRYFRTTSGLKNPKPHEPQDGRLHVAIGERPWEIRFTAAPAAFGEKASLRLLNRQQLDRSISELGLSEATLDLIRTWTDDSMGMLVVAGPTGSGKTTTLYALLHELKMRQRSVVTIEDPVEYQIEGITQLEVHEDHGMTFAQGLKSMLRLDPDYLLVGEVRDAESASTAVDAAGAGHILMTTLHCRDAVGAVTMLRNYAVQDHEIAAALKLVIAQRLVRKLCTKCRVYEPHSTDEKRWLDRLSIECPRRTWHATGCDGCNKTGFHGRLGVFEVWPLDNTCERLIASHASEQELWQRFLIQNHPILLQDGLTKASNGLTTLEELKGMGVSGQGHLLMAPRRHRM